MTDVTVRLRDRNRQLTIAGHDARLLNDALAEIERLRRRVSHLETRVARADNPSPPAAAMERNQ